MGGVPFFTEPGSDIGGQYGSIEEWTLNEPGEWASAKDYQTAKKELQQLWRAGEAINSRLINPVNLRLLETRAARFKPGCRVEKELAETCSRINSLFRQYPNRSIMDGVIPEIPGPDGEDRIYAEQYISFCWSQTQWTFEHLIDMINSYFNECGAIEEPCSLQFFDEPQKKENHDLHFETEFFELIDRIANDLNNLP